MSRQGTILWAWLLKIYSVVVLLFLVAPILVVIPLSFNDTAFFSLPIPAYSFRWYERFLTSNAWLRAGLNSFVIAGLSTALATPLGTIAALGLSRASPLLRVLTSTVMLLPLITPVVIIGVAIYFFMASLGLLGTFAGIVIAHTILATPFVVTIVSAGLAHFDPAQLRAAASMGANPAYALRTVMLPQILPSVVSAALFAFITSFDEAIIVVFLAAHDQYTLTVELWKGIREDINPTVLAVASVMIAIQIAAMALIETLRALSKRRQIKSQAA
jgi:putative spermidine/putrescine transport system permease protein